MRRELLERRPQPAARPEQPGAARGEPPPASRAAARLTSLGPPPAGPRRPLPGVPSARAAASVTPGKSPRAAAGSAGARSRRSELPNPLREQQHGPRWQHCAVSDDLGRRHCAGLPFLSCAEGLFWFFSLPCPSSPSTPGAKQPAGCFLLLTARSRAMSSHALRKRVGGLFSRRRQQRPSSSPCGQPCTAATGASELSDKVQGGLHSRDVPWLRRWRWYFRRFGRDPRGQRRRCFKTALEVNTSNEADVEEDSLRWQEELERVEMELQEVEEKYLNLERCVQKLMATLNDKDREELAAAQELQNQLLAYLENQTTMKGLEEHLQCLEIQNTRLEGTVQQQNDKIEALQRDLQASASLQEVEEKYLNLERCVQNLMATLNDKDREELAAAQELQNQLLAYLENQTTMKGLEEHLQRLEIQNTRLEATVQQQRDKIEALQRDLQASASLREVEEKYLNSERCVQNLMATLDEKERETAASSLKLQDQLSAYLETVKQLEEHVQRLGFENTTLEGTVQQQSDRIDALQRDLQATTSAQAATQDFIKQSRTSHDSLTNQLKDRIRDLECELERIKDTEQETTFQKQCTQAEVQKYKELYLKEVNISKCQAKELERANERLEEANAKLLRERHKSKSLITSSIVSGGLAATPVLYSTALGHLGNNLGLSRSLSLEGSFLNQCEKILSSRKRFATFVTKVQQELDEKITKELKEATAELETGCTGSSKNLHVDQDPLCRAIEEYRDVLTKDYMI